MSKTIAKNRRARHDYTIDDEYEAGLVLTGPEIKSMRVGGCSIMESYISIENNEAFLINAHVAPYEQANAPDYTHEPRRKRKLLLHRQEITKLIDKSQREGYTVIALSLYFNSRGMAKIKIAAAKGKKNYDKREDEKRKEWNREKNAIKM
jgi:SsrA-binding protein